ncbi:hypothetical protein [Vibrio algarum]|uniref:Histidinol-phosphatase n=1 Tax=Vibrio algarum TaxID=3020714 RepID=A0ABT4YM29_9VIBR|nr:hypothetical protein [Vibrio sp. KJ40-1]MDB1122233.1 hypothetical protein [Vibrio sp. KJ40-1]
MKKIDLHVHTVCTISDPAFEFSLDTLKCYVETTRLDCIAITNHNVFRRQQFTKIVDSIDCTVLPGIEVDLEGGISLLSPPNSLDKFENSCTLVEKDIPDSNTSITYERFTEIFGDLNEYILIPHIEKSPSLNRNTLRKLEGYIDCGEVQSVKKFLYAINQKSTYAPVLFSDFRAKKGTITFPPRFTYVDIGDVDFVTLKQLLRDRDRLSLSEDEGNKFFQVLDNGLQISTGLNVILGQRSSGKSYTLDKIVENANEDKIKYIKQFELLEKSDSDDESRFQSKVKDSKKSYIDEYLKEFKAVVDDVVDIDLDYSSKTVDSYLTSLKKFAFNKDRHDSFSATKMFSEVQFKTQNLKPLEDLLAATRLLIENQTYRSTIDKNVNISGLKSLFIDLAKEYQHQYKINAQKIFVNSIIKDTKAHLNVRSATDPVSEVDLYSVAIDKMKVDKFSMITEYLKHEKSETVDTLQGFSVVAKKAAFKGASGLREVNRNIGSFMSVYENYEKPYKFLRSLISNDSVSESDYYKFFCNISYEVQNALGDKVSGGERSEYRLLQSIDDAHKYDMLLIDEPESSFDNVFLLGKVNQLIKDLSKHMPVIIVTHNSTVGASIKPDYLLFTQKQVVDGKSKFSVFTGRPNDKELTDLDNNKHPNYEVLINCLEAGEVPYKGRGESYDALKN